MKIAFLTTDEPFYLPKVFEFIFSEVGNKHAFVGVIVPPVYKGSSKMKLAMKYMKSFGLYETLRLSLKVIIYKLLDAIHLNNGTSYSLSSVFVKHGIPFVYESDVNHIRNLERLKNFEIDLLISVSCPQIFKSPLIKSAEKGCLNLHGAILPKYRGVMPSFWMLANEEEEGGLTLFYVNEKIDAGDVLLQRTYKIEKNETLDSIILKSKRIGAEMIVDAINMIDVRNEEKTPLTQEGGSYFGWPGRKDVLKFLKIGKRFR